MIIDIKDMSKKFKKNTIFSDLNLQIEEKSFITVYGDSGSGKTTLLNIIGLTENYDQGSYKLFGKNAPKVNSRKSLLLRRNKIAYLFQNFGLIENETVEKNLDIALLYSGYSKKKKADEMLSALDLVNLKVDLQQKIYELSGGEQQRVAMARVILKKCDLILADEPTGSVDTKNRNDIISLLKKENQKGKTVILVTHDREIIKNSDETIDIKSISF